jgi:hypothetical protein
VHVGLCACKLTLRCGAVQGESQGEHILILCNAIGSPVDSKVIELEPKFVALTGGLLQLLYCKASMPLQYVTWNAAVTTVSAVNMFIRCTVVKLILTSLCIACAVCLVSRRLLCSGCIGGCCVCVAVQEQLHAAASQ